MPEGLAKPEILSDTDGICTPVRENHPGAHTSDDHGKGADDHGGLSQARGRAAPPQGRRSVRASFSRSAEARDHGDLSENAEYHAAKDAQGLNEARVAELEDKIARAEIIDPSKLSGSTVKFGATVTLEDEDSGEKVKYKIVGEDEADLKAGKISINSPIARALIGKAKGENAEVTTPKSARSFEILKVEFK